MKKLQILTYCAAKKTRTLMEKSPLGPQPSLSTSFSMVALCGRISE